ncbi:MAG TPA: hypothetical protein VK736_04120 [Candidatus Binatia bacterium]|nr:hypothetical protein [Candidatus Binatia bacterium]
MPTDFEPVYRRLKAILEPYGGRLYLTEESSTTYGVDVAPEDERNPTTWFGGVRLGKRYVSYYLMPVYVDPSLAETISPALKKHMQGKSCFNFTRVDEGLFGELAALTKRSYERTAGDPTWGAAKRLEHGMAHRRAAAGRRHDTAPIRQPRRGKAAPPAPDG